MLGTFRKAQGGKRGLHCGASTEPARTASKQNSMDDSRRCSFCNTCQGLDVTLNENSQDLLVSHGNHQNSFLKPVAGAFPFGQGTQEDLGSLYPNALVPKPCLWQESWE